ncbi:MAG: tripartite tricarboxylate transporter TctB family protein, partial [Pseudomonadota bacterium]
MNARRFERTSLLAGLLFVGAALLLLLVLIPYGVDAPRKVKFAALHPAYYPRLVAYALLLIGIATSLTSLRPRANQSTEASSSTNDGRLSVLLALAALALVVFFMLPVLGFPLTTAAALLVAMPLA